MKLLQELMIYEDEHKWPTSKDEIKILIRNLKDKSQLFCGDYNKYKINEDLTVDFWGDTELNSYKGARLPFKFGNIHAGDFILRSLSKLTSLEGCPWKVGGTLLIVKCNMLTTLEHVPEIVDDSFYIEECKALISLEGIQRNIRNGDLKLISLPALKSLKGCPTNVAAAVTIENCKTLVSLEHAPSTIGIHFHVVSSVNSLVNISEYILSVNQFSIDTSMIKSGGIGLLLIKGLEEISIYGSHKRGSARAGKAFGIIQSYLEKGEDGLIECQSELIEAGLEEFAEL